MAKVMTLSEWKTLTYGGALTRRSGLLVDVDKALENYHSLPLESNLDPVRKALMAWIGEKGADWRGSVRNKRGGVDRLLRELGLASDAPNAAAALEMMRREPQRLMTELFHGSQITWKNEFRGKLNLELVKPWSDDFAPKVMLRQYKASGSTNKFGLAGNSASAAVAIKTLSHGAKAASSTVNIGTVRSTISKLVGQVVPPEWHAEVMAQLLHLVPNFMPHMVAAVTPVAGTLTAAGATLWNTANAISKQRGINSTENHLELSLAGETVTDAVNAMIRILERERNADIFAAGVSLTEFGGKLAGTLLDAGTTTTVAIGLAANIAKLMNIVRIVYRDVQEKNAANRMMMVGDLGPQTFAACPLLGCYIVCCLPTSALMTMIADIHGQRGWMDVAENVASQHLQPLRETARKTLAGHRFEILKLARYPGVLEVNEKELERMKANVGRSGMIGFGNNSPRGGSA